MLKIFKQVKGLGKDGPRSHCRCKRTKEGGDKLRWENKHCFCYKLDTQLEILNKSAQIQKNESRCYKVLTFHLSGKIGNPFTNVTTVNA